MCARVFVTKSTRDAGKLIFGVMVTFDGESTKCQNGVRDLDLEMRSVLNKNQNVWYSDIGS